MHIHFCAQVLDKPAAEDEEDKVRTLGALSVCGLYFLHLKINYSHEICCGLMRCVLCMRRTARRSGAYSSRESRGNTCGAASESEYS